MKNIILLFILFTGNLFAQADFVIDNGASIYDLENGEILTSKLVNNKTQIKHYGIDGNLIWEDSIEFQASAPFIDYTWTSRFKGTNQFAVAMYGDLTPDYQHASMNDTLIYQFSIFDLNTQQFLSNTIDTFETRGLSNAEFKDTSIYLFSVEDSMNIYGINLGAFSLSNTGNISEVSPAENITTHYSFRLFSIGDSLYKYRYVEGLQALFSFDAQMNPSDTITTNQGTNLNWNTIYYNKYYNQDSLLVLLQGRTNPNQIRWKMIWNTFRLTELNSSTFTPPSESGPSTITYYTMKWRGTAIDKQKRRIYVLGIPESHYDGHPIKIFMYDYDFNLICEQPIFIGDKDRNQLVEINGSAYLKVKYQNFTEITKLNCSQVGLSENDLDSGISIAPNPTSGISTLVNSSNQSLELSVYSSQGKLIEQFSSDEPSIEINLEKEQSGVYFVTVLSKLKLETLKLIKK